MSKGVPGFIKKLLTQKQRQLDFHFDFIHSDGAKKILISVFDEGKRITFFYMHKKSDGWKIINAPKVDDEFLALEKQLSLVIQNLE